MGCAKLLTSCDISLWSCNIPHTSCVPLLQLSATPLSTYKWSKAVLRYSRRTTAHQTLLLATHAPTLASVPHCNAPIFSPCAAPVLHGAMQLFGPIHSFLSSFLYLMDYSLGRHVISITASILPFPLHTGQTFTTSSPQRSSYTNEPVPWQYPHSWPLLIIRSELTQYGGGSIFRMCCSLILYSCHCIPPRLSPPRWCNIRSRCLNSVLDSRL